MKTNNYFTAIAALSIASVANTDKTTEISSSQLKDTKILHAITQVKPSESKISPHKSCKAE